MAAAGAAGGAVEVLWIGLAGGVLGAQGWHLAGAVAATAAPVAPDAVWAPWLGLGIHFLLSFALAAVFAQTVAHRLHGGALVAAAMGTLGLVWAFNFLVLLPVLNPAFVTLLPLPATLASKLLFGLAMSLVLVHAASAPANNPIPESFKE